MPFRIQRKYVYSPTVLAALCGDVFYEFPSPIKQRNVTHKNDDTAKKGDLDKQRREESSLNDMEFTTAG